MTTVIGLIGGIGSGKSTVARLFQELGAVVLDADGIAHEALEKPEIADAIIRRFGSDVAHDDGSVANDRLARRVFGPHAQAREDLNAIVHPAVRRELDSGLAAAKAEGVPLVVLDVPLLLESRYRGECDRIVFVSAAAGTRKRRVAGRGWDEGELARREASQTPVKDKELAADFVLENDGEMDRLAASVKELFETLVRE